MKTRLPILCLIAAAAFSCNRGERVESADAPSGIRFATLMGKGTMVTNPDSLAKAGGFDVWAYSHPGTWESSTELNRAPLLISTAVTSANNGATWSYGAPVQWPRNDYVTFFACAPANSPNADLNEVTPAGVPVLEYVVNSNPLVQEDFLIAIPQYNQFGPYYAGDRPVDLFFNHVLSRIHFSALVSDDVSAEIRITQVVLKNIYYRGTTSLVMPVVWSPENEFVNNYTLTPGAGLRDIVLTTASQELSSYNGMLFLMPQTIDRSSDPVSVEVTFTVDGKSSSYSSSIFSPASWSPGGSYNYQLLIDASGLHVIVIDSGTTLDDWTTIATVQNIMLTANETTNITRFYAGITNLNLVNESLGLADPCRYFNLYATSNLNHNVTIDMSDTNAAIATDHFTTGEFLVFDFKKTLGVWGKDPGGDPWTVSVINFDTDLWQPVRASQGVDGVSGATKLLNSDSTTIHSRGSIILQRKLP